MFFIRYIAELGAGPLFKANGKIELGLGKIKGRRGRQFCRSFDFSWSVTNDDKMTNRTKITNQDTMTNNDKMTKKKKTNKTKTTGFGRIKRRGGTQFCMLSKLGFYFHKHLQRLSFFLNRKKLPCYKLKHK